MEFIKNLFKAIFKKEHKPPEVNVNWETGTMIIKADKKLSQQEIMELVEEQIRNKENGDE